MTKIKKRGYLNDVYTLDKTRVRIAFYLYEANAPLILSVIAEKTKITPQLVAHHLPIMMKEGIVISRTIDGKKYYMLQPFFYDKGIMENIFKNLIPIVEYMGSNNNLIIENSDDSSKVILNCIQTMVHFVNIEIEQLKPRFK